MTLPKRELSLEERAAAILREVAEFQAAYFSDRRQRRQPRRQRKSRRNGRFPHSLK